jgi:hypothetical protein
MSGFTKLHASIVNSSVWDESDSVRIIWVTMLAMADAAGFVESSLPGLAHQARKSREETEQALAVLSSPDPDSKNPDHEGRRIQKVEGGWILLNYVLYREKAEVSDDPEKTATRERVRRHRERKQVERLKALHGVTVTLPSITNVTPASASASASASVPTAGIGHGRVERGRPASEQDVTDYCATLNLPRSDGEYVWAKWNGNGFTNDGRPMKDWQAVIRSHAKAGYLPSQKQKEANKSHATSNRNAGTFNAGKADAYGNAAH